MNPRRIAVIVLVAVLVVASYLLGGLGGDPLPP